MIVEPTNQLEPEDLIESKFFKKKVQAIFLENTFLRGEGEGERQSSSTKTRKFVREEKKRRAIAPFRIQKPLDSLSFPYLLGAFDDLS